MNAKILSALLASAACFTLLTSVAEAGFQWTAPTSQGVQRTQTPTAPNVQASPVAPVITENLPTNLEAIGNNTPMYTPGSVDDPVMWNPPAGHNTPTNAPISTPSTSSAREVYIPRSPQSVLPKQAAQNAPAPQAQTMQAPAPSMQQVQSSVISPNTSMSDNTQYAMAEGFGSDLPLVMAIRQIIPTEFSFVFDEGINLSSQVSWQGGQPWNVVLQNLLAPLQLKALISGNTVSILPSHKSSELQNATASDSALVVSEAIIQSGQNTVQGMAPANMSAPNAGLLQTAVLQEQVILEPVLASATRPDLHAKTVWTAPKNSTLRSILEDWSNRVGVELYWASEYDYPVQAGVTISGSFEEAVQVLLRGLSESKPRPLGRLHPNLPNGPAVLLIETRDGGL